MRVMVLVKATEDSEKGFVRTAETMEMMEAMGRFNDELVKAGILKDGSCDGLTPSSQGKRVAFDGRDRTVIDGFSVLVEQALQRSPLPNKRRTLKPGVNPCWQAVCR